jgi:PncC family amidohydrolase
LTSFLPPDLLQRAERVIQLATDQSKRIAIVETVTGGLVALSLSEVPGASRVLERSFVLYHEAAKVGGLGTDRKVGEEFGVVSAELTSSLAGNLAEASGADIGVAVTGYAGPTGGSVTNPVGTVYTAPFIRGLSATNPTRHQFPGNRGAVKTAAAIAALAELEVLLTRGSRI